MEIIRIVLLKFHCYAKYHQRVECTDLWSSDLEKMHRCHSAKLSLLSWISTTPLFILSPSFVDVGREWKAFLLIIFIFPSITSKPLLQHGFFSLHCPSPYFGHLKKWGRLLLDVVFSQLFLSCFIWVRGITLVTSTVLKQSPTTERNSFSSSGFHQSHTWCPEAVFVIPEPQTQYCVVGLNVPS